MLMGDGFRGGVGAYKERSNVGRFSLTYTHVQYVQCNAFSHQPRVFIGVFIGIYDGLGWVFAGDIEEVQ